MQKCISQIVHVHAKINFTNNYLLNNYLLLIDDFHIVDLLLIDQDFRNHGS